MSRVDPDESRNLVPQNSAGDSCADEGVWGGAHVLLTIVSRVYVDMTVV